MKKMKLRFYAHTRPSDCPLKFEMLHLCSGFPLTLPVFGRTPSFLAPFGLFLLLLRLPPWHFWRSPLAGQAAADIAMLRCQKAELRV